MNKAGDSFATDTATYNYDSNDTYTVDGTPVTMPAFEAAPEQRDSVTGIYAPDSAASSSFNLTDTNPEEPTNVTASQDGSAVDVAWTAPSGDVDSYNVYRASVPATATDCSAVPSTGWTQVGSSTTTTYTDKTVTVPADSSTNSYCYAGHALSTMVTRATRLSRRPRLM